MRVLAVHVVDEAAARRELRRQIAVLEARGNRAAGGARSGPRLLGLRELEEVRDALASGRTCKSGGQNPHICTFEAMVADPARHRHVRIPLAALGRPGCGEYRVKPRLGIIGRLAGWWQITLSSGCP